MGGSAQMPLLTAVTILVVATLAGPVFGVPERDDGAGCQVASPLGTGSADVSVTALPDSAVIERARFGAGTWRLNLPPADVSVGPVSGRPILTYKIRVEGPDLTWAVAGTTALSRCQETTRLGIGEGRFDPRTVEEQQYAGTITVTYKGTRGERRITRRLATKNVTVTVDR